MKARLRSFPKEAGVRIRPVPQNVHPAEHHKDGRLVRAEALNKVYGDTANHCNKRAMVASVVTYESEHGCLHGLSRGLPRFHVTSSSTHSFWHLVKQTPEREIACTPG